MAYMHNVMLLLSVCYSRLASRLANTLTQNKSTAIVDPFIWDREAPSQGFAGIKGSVNTAWRTV